LIGLRNVAVSGDTRFDSGGNFRKDNSLEYISQFKDNTLTIVVGSSWPKDENLLLDFINNNEFNVKFIIAPTT
jgi:3-deoxy-D-manno-octulosonic-acid transferase